MHNRSGKPIQPGHVLRFLQHLYFGQLLQNGGKCKDFVGFLKTLKTGRGPYSFDGRRPLLELAQRLPGLREVWILKGAQVGLSTLAVGWCLYQTWQEKRSVGYALPTKVFARRFLKTRFPQVVWGHPGLQEAVTISQDVGLMTMQREGEEASPAYLYMLGMENITDAISIPLDALMFDEVDVLNRENIAWADDRLAASTFGQKVYFSVGMHPGLGIDAGYAESTQRVWLVRCHRCGRDDQVMEELFPGCVRRIRDQWTRVCVACGRPLDVEACGRWVPRHPGRRVEGYRIPQLIVPAISLDYIMDRWDRARKRRSLMAKFRCSTLALPDAGERQRITAELLAGTLADYPTAAAADWTIGGADVGDTCYAAFADVQGGQLRFLRLETVSSDHMVAELSAMIQALHCRCFVIDAQPFRSEARRLARLHPDVVVLQYFKDRAFGTGTELHEGHTYHTVSEQREDSLDAYCDLFDPDRRGVLFPRFLGTRNFMETTVAAHHLKGSQKVEALDWRSGKWMAAFPKGVENHYLMACNNARKALVLLATGHGPAGVGVLPVFGGS